jgi:ketosteroid isomerase-like protein
MATSATGFDEAARAIRAMDREFMDNVKSRDAARLVDAFYADTARVLPPNHVMVEGKPAIAEFWKGILDSGVSAIDLDTTQIEVSGSLAHAIGTCVIHTPAGNRRGKYLVAYRQEPDRRWKAVADMFSFDE